ncbi:MAG: 5-bromo-4-chloroindolyl phosphate hydrolysis family protein [Roseburia sp.]|nr:5-bromo-4-chloroindolyl phosphate hydrolysis family protein [Roseburia sp.]
MSNEQNWKNMGEQIRASVSEAIQTGDYAQLNQLVSDTVSSALREAKNQAGRMKEQTPRQKAQTRPVPVSNGGLVRLKRVGSVSGVLYMVFGGIGMGLSVCGLIAVGILCILGIVGSGWFFGLLALMAAFGGMIRLGSKKGERLKRAERYIQLCGNKMYGILEELARQTGKSLRFIRKDIRKMLEIGMFPEGHLDEKQTCFMLNDVIYHQYTQTENAYRLRQETERLKDQTQQSALTGQQEESRRQENELNAMIAEGMECTRKLRELNDKIEDEKISKELFSLEKLLKEIFDSLREHPEQMHRMHKLMDYYLPTTVKLVEAYEEFDQVSVPGEDILAAKAEIEKTLGVINGAFAELLNALFQDAALDVTTDAQVLQTMLAREGLTREAFVSEEK